MRIFRWEDRIMSSRSEMLDWEDVSGCYNHNVWNIRNLGFLFSQKCNIKTQMMRIYWSFSFSVQFVFNVHAEAFFSPSRPHITTTTGQLAMQRSGIINNIAQGYWGTGTRRELMQSALKRFMSTLLNLLITHSFIYDSKGAGGGWLNQPCWKVSLPW